MGEPYVDEHIPTSGFKDPHCYELQHLEIPLLQGNLQ